MSTSPVWKPLGQIHHFCLMHPPSGLFLPSFKWLSSKVSPISNFLSLWCCANPNYLLDAFKLCFSAWISFCKYLRYSYWQMYITCHKTRVDLAVQLSSKSPRRATVEARATFVMWLCHRTSLAPKTNVEHWILLNNIMADWHGNRNNTYCIDIFHLTRSFDSQ
jgi:hypothetical protein